jgi:hypothetical protein
MMVVIIALEIGVSMTVPSHLKAKVNLERDINLDSESVQDTAGAEKGQAVGVDAGHLQ